MDRLVEGGFKEKIEVSKHFPNTSGPLRKNLQPGCFCARCAGKGVCVWGEAPRLLEDSASQTVGGFRLPDPHYGGRRSAAR